MTRRSERGPGRPSKAGAVGVCGSCGKQVLPRHVGAGGRHTAIVTYGKNRVRCGGAVIPLEQPAAPCVHPGSPCECAYWHPGKTCAEDHPGVHCRCDRGERAP